MAVFKTFFMGGFECSDALNSAGKRINLLRDTKHDLKTNEDYGLLAAMGIMTVREGVCWSSVETQPYLFDFTEVKNRMDAADEYGIQQIWDLCHFGYPDGLHPGHPHFCLRFMALCQAFALFYKDYSTQQLFVVPINEIGYLSSHASNSNGAITTVIRENFEIKYNLCKAAIIGIRQLRQILPDCKVVVAENLIKVHQSNETDPEQFYHLNENQFQVIDIISGKRCAELGGSENFIDIIGLNYYWNSQWEDCGESLPWPELVEERVPLSSLLKMAYSHYEKPVFLSGTGHFGEDKAAWIEEVTFECLKALDTGVEVEGICIYPVIVSPDSDHHSIRHDCGIWELDKKKKRLPQLHYMRAIRECIKMVENSRMQIFTFNFPKGVFHLN